MGTIKPSCCESCDPCVDDRRSSWCEDEQKKWPYLVHVVNSMMALVVAFIFRPGSSKKSRLLLLILCFCDTRWWCLEGPLGLVSKVTPGGRYWGFDHL